jgi:chorismate--pyruvate lyase
MIRSLPFNLKLKIMALHWQSYSALSESPPAKLIPWLLDPDSFMQRLRQHAIHSAKVQVLEQTWQFPNGSERHSLDLPARQYGLVREVVISSPQQKWMFARTIFPRTTVTGSEQRLGNLKSRALGTLLFNKANTVRGAFEFTVIKSGESWHKKIVQATQVEPPEFWARRSVFSIKHKSLLLCEIFLPDLLEL